MERKEKGKDLIEILDCKICFIVLAGGAVYVRAAVLLSVLAGGVLLR
jgi:hypothetical protein